MYPLYDPLDARDACGVGFVADRSATASHALVRLGIECLHNLDHRGAKSADGTGDGAGVMTRIPYRIIERDLVAAGIEPPPRHALGVVMVFHSQGGSDRGRRIVADALEPERIELLHWRSVPVGSGVLSRTAGASEPLIEQVVVVAPDDVTDPEEFERRLFLARRRAESAGLGRLSIPSASARTVVYKGLFTASHIEEYYWDLRDPAYESDFVVFHQRYSTNTAPSWHLAQPFRMVAHNGEINTVRANRSWMAARSNDLHSEVWGDRIFSLWPLVSSVGSDSASLDEAFDVLVRSGRSVAHVKEMLIPAAWENVNGLDPALGAFYEYHAFLTEPWDGPAAIVACDGRQLVAGLDRNGLRPARWAITDDVVIVASEAGVAPGEEIRAIATGQLGPGELFLVDLDSGKHSFSDDVKRQLAAQAPYDTWIRTQTNYVNDPFDSLQDDRFDADSLSRVFGYTAEERRLILKPMAGGIAPILSMGHDTGLAALSAYPHRLTRFFHQAFAQVTNPPMDPIRERLVMSLRTYLGRRGSLLEETAQQARLIELPSPVLSDAEVEQLRNSTDPAFQAAYLEALFPAEAGPGGLVAGLDDLCDRAEAAVRDGTAILILSDRETDVDRAPIPMVLAVGAVHHRLIDAGLRLRASIVAVSGEPRDAHDLACLVGFGASAVNAYLAIEHVRAMAEAGDVQTGVIEAQENYRASLEVGLLKIMSKMGVCTVSSYRGSELFEAIGLDVAVSERAFRYVSTRVEGWGFDDIASAVLERHSRYDTDLSETEGYYKHRAGGIPHRTTPRTVLALQKAVRSGDWKQYEAYLDLVEVPSQPTELRDLLEINPIGPPLDVSEVEPVERIVRRFTTAAMSHGALSAEAHEALAEAMNHLGAASNSGEGGEDPLRYGTSRNSVIKQVASGRFGVTPRYLASADEFQIKMAQGSKPGEGGQLPGHKVTDEIAALRHTEPGVTLISPPPHHDIYSIEDLAQLIYDLKTFKPTARVGVKLVSGPGVGTIAVGVAKAHADVVLVSGNAGGTGASSLVSIKHAGSPWEIGVAEAHQALAANGLRTSVTLETDGGLRTGRDVIVAALLGADRFGFGTLPLLALGCKMVRQCHENTCPVGITTQREDLRAKFTGSVDQVIQLFTLLATDVQRKLARMGAASIEEIVGRGDLLVPHDKENSVGASFSRLLVDARPDTERSFRTIPRSPLGDVLADQTPTAGSGNDRIELRYPIRNRDRAVGTRLSGSIAGAWDQAAPDEAAVSIGLIGSAGQSLGAFLTGGVSIDLDGTGNDGVGKGMGGGVIVIRPSVSGEGVPHGAGNACLYGATGGGLFVSGAVGQRFAVRNSGARAVVEGASDHCCEYMTGGAVVVLGSVGGNVAAGMTGGVLFIWDPDLTAKARFSDTAPPASRLSDAEAHLLHDLVVEHYERTGSSIASELLASWSAARDQFWVLRPLPPSALGAAVESESASSV
ncbi:MAG: glutamate synthase large subunit [Acidimicrobiia bacterium]